MSANKKDELEDGELSSDLEDINLGISDAEKKRLAALSEIEREEELFKYAEKVETEKSREEIRRRLKSKKRSGDTDSSSRKFLMSSSNSEDTNSNDSDSYVTGSSRYLPSMQNRKARLKEKHRHISDALQNQIAKRQKLQEKESQRMRCLLPMDGDGVMPTPDMTTIAASSSLQLPETLQSSLSWNNVFTDGQYLYYVPTAEEAKDAANLWYMDTEGLTEQSETEKPTASSISTEAKIEEPQQPTFSIIHARKIQLSGDVLEKWVHMPFFDEVVRGCFVRVRVEQSAEPEKKYGASSSAPQPPPTTSYQCALVLHAVEGDDAYDLSQTRTNKILKVHFGDREASLPLSSICNSFLSQAEFDAWYPLADAAGQDLIPSLHQLENKQQEVRSAYDYRVQDNKVLEAILESKRRFQKRTSSIAMRKANLTKLLDIAETNNNAEDVQKYREELRLLEEEAQQVTDRQRQSHTGRKIDFTHIRSQKLQLQEALKREAKMEKHEEEEEEHNALEGDLFQRRSTRPCMLTKEVRDQLARRRNMENGSPQVAITADHTESSSSASTREKPTPPQMVAMTTGGRLNPFKSALKDDSLHQIHDFDINLDLLETSAGDNSVMSVAVNGCKSQENADAAPAKTGKRLNLDEYKRKRGLI